MQKGFTLKLLIFIIFLLGIVAYYFNDDIKYVVNEINATILARSPIDCTLEFILAENTKTQECRDFPSPCRVPQGWVKVDGCSDGGDNAVKYLCNDDRGRQCPVGFSCKLEGKYSDALSVCVRN